MGNSAIDWLKTRNGKYVLAIVIGYLLSYVTVAGYFIAGGALAFWLLSSLAIKAKSGKQT